MIKRRLSKLKDKLYENGLDGYVIPKNDEFFSEYSQKDRLKTISNFTGSAGLAIILKNKNYLFVDGRYTIQAEIETGKVFKIINIFTLRLEISAPWIANHISDTVLITGYIGAIIQAIIHNAINAVDFIGVALFCIALITLVIL